MSAQIILGGWMVGWMDGEICDWRLTKTSAFDEIEDLLIDLTD